MNCEMKYIYKIKQTKKTKNIKGLDSQTAIGARWQKTVFFAGARKMKGKFRLKTNIKTETKIETTLKRTT